MPLKVNHLWQAFSNAIFCTVVQRLTKCQLILNLLNTEPASSLADLDESPVPVTSPE